MNKEKLISIEKYSAWVLCNIIFCVLPIGIIWLIGELNGDLNLSVVFSSMLAFLFTLMIISMYNYFPYPRLRKGSVFEEILTFSSILMLCAVLVFFILYNVMPKVQQFMNTNMQYWLLLLLALVLAIILNRPVIDARIKEKRDAVRVADAFGKGKQKREKWIDTITGGGRNENE